ncbi:branched-chain amino acid ABC transporter permease [Actinoplanes sp. ATCC 53533]|uniref:branched-chain amino acid ABC transporter permease n=1 Tax=Actinoplanes sp. ATCC 53533 TaxID=1288362 RepID=UPI000F7AFD5C|nr:branched-chain amino acid ABC transporter permease [Actinoplanes sp. ATCC 53533]RSM40841.1 branched-chain amino acid ABC transporter permease [Actinoplanes sp. ATCC 53533]
MTWINALLQGVLLGGLYALFATGLSVMFGVMRIVNLAHGDLSILAAFIAFALVDSMSMNPWLALLVTIPVLAAFGYSLQRLVLNRVQGSDVLAPLLVTFGLSIVLQNTLLDLFSSDSRALDIGAFGTASLRLSHDVSVGWFTLTTFAVAVAVLAGLRLFLSRTAFGRVMRATSDDQEAAQLMGVNNRHVYGMATAIAFGTLALAGVFLGMRTTFDPSLGPGRLIFAFEAVVIGGIGNVWGTLLGGVVLGVAQTLGAQVSPAYSVLSGHLVFLAVLILRPRGILGVKGVQA